MTYRGIVYAAAMCLLALVVFAGPEAAWAEQEAPAAEAADAAEAPGVFDEEPVRAGGKKKGKKKTTLRLSLPIQLMATCG